MDIIGKIYQAHQGPDGRGMRRCCVCEELFTREAAREHYIVSCRPAPQQAQVAMAAAAVAGNS
jgi:hypothetical protein